MAEKKKPDSWLIQKSNMVWFGSVIFVAAWMFVLGVYVGRGTAPIQFDIEKIEKELADLKEAVLKKEKQKETLETDVSKETALGFYEKLKDPDEKIKKYDINIDNKVKKKAYSSTESVTPRRKPPEHIPAPPKTQNTLTVQVASLKDPKVADRLVAQLKEKGFAAYRETGMIPEKGTWYRVRVGEFNTSDDAQPVLNQLKKDGFAAIMITR